MSKTMVCVSIVVCIITFSALHVAEAQVPTVPEPVCVDVPGIPCPGHKSVGPLQEAQSLDVPETGESGLFNDLMRAKDSLIRGGKDLIETIAHEINLAFTFIFDTFRNIYEKIGF